MPCKFRRYARSKGVTSRFGELDESERNAKTMTKHSAVATPIAESWPLGHEVSSFTRERSHRQPSAPPSVEQVQRTSADGARSSAVEHPVHIGMAAGSIPAAPTNSESAPESALKDPDPTPESNTMWKMMGIWEKFFYIIALLFGAAFLFTVAFVLYHEVFIIRDKIQWHIINGKTQCNLGSIPAAPTNSESAPESAPKDPDPTPESAPTIATATKQPPRGPNNRTEA